MSARWHIGAGDELALEWEGDSSHRILILPALLDEANKLRRFTVEVARRLAGSGHACLIPDLPGQNESTAPQVEQSLDSWQTAAARAAERWGATHVLSLRSSAMIAPDRPGWRYAPVGSKTHLRSLLRSRTIAAREAGRTETAEDLMRMGLIYGLELAGFDLSPEMISQMANSDLIEPENMRDIPQADLGGPGLWLRAEAGFDAQQADALAAILAMDLI